MQQSLWEAVMQYVGPAWLDYRQAARRIGRSENTIKRYRRDGMPMPLRDGRRIVREDVLLAWYRERLQAWPIHQARMQAARRADREPPPHGGG